MPIPLRNGGATISNGAKPDIAHPVSHDSGQPVPEIDENDRPEFWFGSQISNVQTFRKLDSIKTKRPVPFRNRASKIVELNSVDDVNSHVASSAANHPKSRFITVSIQVGTLQLDDLHNLFPGNFADLLFIRCF